MCSLYRFVLSRFEACVDSASLFPSFSAVKSQLFNSCGACSARAKSSAIPMVGYVITDSTCVQLPSVLSMASVSDKANSVTCHPAQPNRATNEAMQWGLGEQ